MAGDPMLSIFQKWGQKGKDAIRTKLKELQSVGAMRIEAIKGADGNGRPPVLQLPAD